MPGSASADDLLYHYTSESGLRGIIESDRIWATNIRFLNDYTEFQRAFKDKYLEPFIEVLRTSIRRDADTTAMLVIDGMLAARNHGPILKIIESSAATNDTFVCSFTSSLHDGFDPGDRLSQWRGYSHSCQGFSLGFDHELLAKQIAIDNPGAKASVSQCIYEGTGPDIEFFRGMGRDAALRFNEFWVSGEAVPDSFETMNAAAPEDYRKTQFYFLRALSKATAEFFTKAAQIKHIGFREECEWRIILQASHDALARSGITKLRKGPFGETPYIEIPLGLPNPGSPLRRIVVGPGKDTDDLESWVERFIETHGMRVRASCVGGGNHGVDVCTSAIPYRTDAKT